MLKLYPHNQTALDAVYKTWEEGNRFAAIVHAVGTGKSFIYHRLIQDNPSSKILVLNPTRYIFDVQQEAVKKPNLHTILILATTAIHMLRKWSIKGIRPFPGVTITSFWMNFIELEQKAGRKVLQPF